MIKVGERGASVRRRGEGGGGVGGGGGFGGVGGCLGGMLSGKSRKMDGDLLLVGGTLFVR